MYIESIEFKREEKSNWEKGYYIGDTDNSDKSIFLDLNYKPLKNQLWNYRTNLDDWLQVRIPLKGELE
ncbi:TPA: hypothetical protein LA460_000108 [Clostridium botulinum]|nr:hypothetical protein [Clostridium botulinum]HBJ1652713.1 hypothetical protein [Clostridium botulinum]